MLVLSLFPGIGLLDMAFEEEEFCIVRGPDLLWGGDIRSFHPPAAKFDGVIGGPPCQAFSGLRNFSHRWRRRPENLIPEFERVIREAQPAWFVMENVPAAPSPISERHIVRAVVVDNRQFGAEQSRLRSFHFGTSGGSRLDGALAELVQSSPINGNHARTVTASHGGGRPRMAGTIETLSVEEAIRRQEAPVDIFGPISPFKREAQLKMIAQGVPLPMGRAVAKAVKRALQLEPLMFDPQRAQ